MGVSKLVLDAERGLEESQNQRDARVEALWLQLDPGRTGELDLKGLRKGFRRIDHRELRPAALALGNRINAHAAHTAMKNADDLLQQIMEEVDTNRDGKIQYEGTLGLVNGVLLQKGHFLCPLPSELDGWSIAVDAVQSSAHSSSRPSGSYSFFSEPSTRTATENST